MVKQFVLSKWQQIPTEVRGFLKRSLMLLIIWQLLYVLLLFPARVLDDSLTRFTGIATEKVLTFFYSDRSFRTEHLLIVSNEQADSKQIGTALVWMGAQPLIHIADACNGLNMYALFIGFLLAYPALTKLKVSFGFLGLVTLIAVNIARCAGLAVLQIHHPSFTVFAHHYIFNVLTYTTVFGLWYWFTKNAAK